MQDDRTRAPFVDVQIFSDPEKPHVFSVDIEAMDGTPLSPQMLLDAFSDALLHTFGHLGKQTLRVHLDS